MHSFWSKIVQIFYKTYSFYYNVVHFLKTPLFYGVVKLLRKYVLYYMRTRGGIMKSSNEIKQDLIGLYKKYYDVEYKLKNIGKYEIGDGTELDIESTKLSLLWINIRSEIFYQRFSLAQSYINNF